jgi:hypothetical protein
MEKRKSRSNSSDSSSRKSADSRSYSIDSFSSSFSSSEDLVSLDVETKSSLMKPIEVKSQNYVETPHRRKRESSYQAQSKSPNIEYVLTKIFRHKDVFLKKREGVE